MIHTLADTPTPDLTRQQIELINRKTIRYPIQTAEKDYQLALAIQRIAESSLGDKLVFKGGTALHHCYLEQLRFSEDLDFTAQDSVTVGELSEVLEEDGLFTARKRFTSSYSVKIERLQYAGALGQPGNIKVEIDLTQSVLLPAVKTQYTNVWGVHSVPLVMDKLEMCAEKIRAVSQRARYRDFYDLYLLLKRLHVPFDEAVELLKQKKNREQISASNIAVNWQVAQEQQSREMGAIHCSEEISDTEIVEMISSLCFDDIE